MTQTETVGLTVGCGSTSVTLIAKTDQRFADFRPFVASINNRGTVAFAATLTDGSSAVFVGDGAAVRRVELATKEGAPRVTSHPDIADDGSLCVYVAWRAGLQAVLLVSGRQVQRVAMAPGVLARVGPLGPVMNNCGLVAFRGTAIAGGPGIYLGGRGGRGAVESVADTRNGFRDFDGLPCIADSGTVVFRTVLDSGNDAICLHAAGRTRVVAETGPVFSDLGRFPMIANGDVIGFCGSLTDAGAGVFTMRGGERTTVADVRDGFVSFRGVLVDASGGTVFYATPNNGALGIYRGRHPDENRVIGVGDRLWGETITAFALNPVSMNRGRQLALRVEFEGGGQAIVRVDEIDASP